MKIFDSKTFGQAIRNRRKALGYTQQDISDFTGLSVSFISDLERGKKTAELEKCLYVAGILGLDIELEARTPGFYANPANEARTDVTRDIISTKNNTGK